MDKLKITVCGGAGRMGRMITALIIDADDLELAGATEPGGSPFIGQDCGTLAGRGEIGVKISDLLEQAAGNADVVIDFTTPQATLENARNMPGAVRGLVVGTTGMDDAQIEELRKISEGRLSVVFSPNMSVGVNVLFSILRKAAAVLQENYDVEIVEYHHNKKKDAPSGTAKKFGQIIAQAQQSSYEERVKHGREGLCPRKPSDIGMHAVRAGDIIGEHSIVFAGCSEIIEFKHTALSREAFAKGSLAGARFLASAQQGWYSMEDVFGVA